MNKVFLLFVLSAFAFTVQGENWPQLRGPDQTGIIRGFEIPTEWDLNTHVKWKTPTPGKGWSSPVVWGDRVFLMVSNLQGRDQDSRTKDRISLDNVYKLEVVCLDKRNGKLLWRKCAYEGNPKVMTHSDSPYAAESPATDGERVFAHFATMGLYAYNFDGQLAWKKDFGVYEVENNWGSGSSPMIHNGVLYLQLDNEDYSALVALDSASGKELWRVNRNEGTNWSSPIIWKNRLRTELITQGDIVRSYNPDNGELLWQLYMQGGRNSSLPVGDDDRLIIGNEKRRAGGFLFSVKAGASGDISLADGQTSNKGVEWVNPNGGIAMSSPLLYGDFVYAFERRTGMVSCYDASTGDVYYYRKHVKKARQFWSSPWAYDGKVFCTDANGITHAIEIGPDFVELQMNDLEDTVWAMPAITPGSIIIRGVNNVYCIEEE